MVCNPKFCDYIHFRLSEPVELESGFTQTENV